MYPGAVLNGYESCSDGSDEWGDPDVSQQDRDERDLTEAEIYLLDNYRKASLVEDILGVGLCFIWPLLWFAIISPRLLQSDRFISKFPRYYIAHPKRYNKEINRLETERNSIISEVAVKKAQMAKKAQNINYINNNPEKIEKENSGLAKLGERGATQLMKVRGLESKIETKWDSIRHLIPYSEMLDNQDS